MIEILLILLATGFVIYYLVRHPIKSLKYTISILGLLILGALGISLAVLGVSTLVAIL